MVKWDKKYRTFFFAFLSRWSTICLFSLFKFVLHFAFVKIVKNLHKISINIQHLFRMPKMAHERTVAKIFFFSNIFSAHDQKQKEKKNNNFMLKMIFRSHMLMKRNWTLSSNYCCFSTEKKWEDWKDWKRKRSKLAQSFHAIDKILIH